MSTPIIIEKTQKTPYVSFDMDQGIFTMTGSLLPTNSFGFFDAIFSLVADYLKKPAAKTKINITLDYFNTSSSKLLLQMLIQFETLVTMGKEVYMYWYYDAEDLDMLDAGNTYQASIKIPTIISEIE